MNKNNFFSILSSTALFRIKSNYLNKAILPFFFLFSLFSANAQIECIGEFTPTLSNPNLIGLFTTVNASSAANGFASVRPTFVDLDSDGDQDLVLAEKDGTTKWYKNTGSATNPEFNTGPFNLGFPLFGANTYIAPTFVDIDADGDYDAYMGRSSGQIYYMRNDGTKTSPNFGFSGFNQLSFVSVSGLSVPGFVDFDMDGDMDCFVADGVDGDIHYYENTGTNTTESFTEIIGSGNYFDGDIYAGYLTIDFGKANCFPMDGYVLGKDDGTMLGLGPDDDSDCGGLEWNRWIGSLAGVDVGTNARPVLVDLDGDGDDDLVVGKADGTLEVLENVIVKLPLIPCDLLNMSTSEGFYAPTFTDIDNDAEIDVFVGEEDGGIYESYEGYAYDYSGLFYGSTPDLFTTLSFGNHAAPAFVDIDGDGDEDVFFGEEVGNINFFENSGTFCSTTNPKFNPIVGPPTMTSLGNPFNAVDVGSHSTPTFADMDGDGDADAFVGEQDGIINYFRNDPDPLINPLARKFTQLSNSSNPMNGNTVGSYSAPTLVDIDADGDYDLFVGDGIGNIHYYVNDDGVTGSEAINPTFTTAASVNPFGLADVGNHAKPTFYDVDRDGDFDVFVGTEGGYVWFFENVGDANNPDFIDKTCPEIACSTGSISGNTTLAPVTAFQTDYMNTGGSFMPGNGGVLDNTPGVWIKLKLAASSTVTLTTCDPVTNYDTKIFALYPDFYAKTSNDDDGSCGTSSTVRFDVDGAFSLERYIFVTGKAGATGNFKLNIHCGDNTCHNYKYYTNVYTLPSVTHAATDIEINQSGNPILGPYGDVFVNPEGNDAVDVIAGNSIFLGPGFDTSNNSFLAPPGTPMNVFHAYIQGCTGTVNLKGDNTKE